MEAITRGFLLGVENEEGKNCSIKDSVLYSYSSPVAWWRGKNSLSVDMDVVKFSKASKRLFNQLQRDMSICNITFEFVESGINIIKEPIRSKTNASLEPENKSQQMT